MRGLRFQAQAYIVITSVKRGLWFSSCWLVLCLQDTLWIWKPYRIKLKS
jgi:hypothetical protein